MTTGTAPKPAPGFELAALRAAASRALEKAPLIHVERAREIMEREGIDALLVTREANVFEFSTYWPVHGRMGNPNTCFALLTRRPGDAVGLVIPQFTYYYIFADLGVADSGQGSGVQPFLYTGSGTTFDPSSAAAPPILFRAVDDQALSARERKRRERLAAAGPMHGSASAALGAMLREYGLAQGVVACDDPDAEALVAETGLATRTRPGSNLLRHIRLVKSAAEITLMRYAASANAEAALATARAARELGGIRAVRERYYAELAARGGTGVFMVVDGSNCETYDAPLVEGSAFLIDCVGRFHNYHGDYARTVFVGEPTARMSVTTEALALGWSAIQERLRPGISYSQIREVGAEALRKGGFDVQVGFNPHSVGLWHGDDPRRDEAPRSPRDEITLEPGMILSVDCPAFDTGIGGTAHLEDLVLITRDGFEPLNDMGSRIVVT
jgi:Xaa-Pro aminopeptidase